MSWVAAAIGASGLLGAFALSHTNAVTGVSANGAVGTVSDKGISIGITGNAATGATGTVTQSAQVALSGVEAVGEEGYLSVPLSPLTATGNVGSVEFEFRRRLLEGIRELGQGRQPSSELQRDNRQLYDEIMQFDIVSLAERFRTIRLANDFSVNT